MLALAKPLVGGHLRLRGITAFNGAKMILNESITPDDALAGAEIAAAAVIALADAQQRP